VSGFRSRQLNAARKIKPGDKLICYMTKLSRWIAVLEVNSKYYKDETPRFYESNDPFIVRFKVKPIAVLQKEKAIPIKESVVWDNLSFTRDIPKHGTQWTGPIRSSLKKLNDEDGEFLEDLIIKQTTNNVIYPVDEKEYEKYLTRQIRGEHKSVTVSVPEDEIESKNEFHEIRESARIQALLSKIGETMGFRIWLPKSDRNRVMQEWEPESGKLIENLPLNYDQVTIKTIEQIDVLWLKRRSIVRAFEIEHTTSIYSGLLRMADLLALQPNMDIKLHIVSPVERREKVFEEIQRPVFSLLEKGPLAEYCTYLSYDSIRDLSDQKYLNRLSDSVLEDYEEVVE
jgi:predicted RNA-binding protein